MNFRPLSRYLLIVWLLLLNTSIFAAESARQIEAIKKSLYPLAAMNATATKLRTTCPDLVLPQLIRKEEVEAKVLEKTGISLDEFIQRGEMQDQIAIIQDKNERTLQEVLKSCSLSDQTEQMDEFQYQFGAAFKDFDYQLTINARKANLKAPAEEVDIHVPGTGPLNQAQIKKLISRAETIVVSRIVPLSQVPDWYRKRYFGFGYMQNKVFKIMMGWKDPLPLYVGVHPLFFDDEMLADPNKRWLLYVDDSNTIIYAIAEAQASNHLALLGESSYSVSRAGEFIRSTKSKRQ